MEAKITSEEIEKDIEVFKTRIAAAQKILVELPVGRLSYAASRKRNKKSCEAKAEIEHVKNLIAIAEGALL